MGDLDSFEMLGGLSRIPRIQDLIQDKYHVDLATHLNGDEAMAHGAAVIAANFSAVV